MMARSTSPFSPSAAVEPSSPAPAPSSTTNLTSASISTNSSPGRLSRGTSFRIPLPPSSPSLGSGDFGTSPSAVSPGGGTSSSLRLFSGFRRNRGQSNSRDLREQAAAVSAASASTGAALPSPGRSSPALNSIGGASQSSTDLPMDTAWTPQQQPPQQHNHYHSQSTPSHSTPQQLSSSTSSARSYFPIMGRMGRRKHTIGANGSGSISGTASFGVSSSNNAAISNRTPTHEQPPPMLRTRSSSQPSLVTADALAQSGAGAAGPATTTLPHSAVPILSSSHAPSSSVSGSTVDIIPSSTAATPTHRVRPSQSGRSGEPLQNNLLSPTSPSMPRRSLDAGTSAISNANVDSINVVASTNGSHNATASTSSNSSSSAQHIRLVPHLESTRSLAFDPVSREVVPSIPLRIGRFTDRGPNQPITAVDAYRVAFKSKVVSRTHAEIWFDPSPPAGTPGATTNGGGWFIRDLKSSSGTFLNHIRLSGAGMESRPFPLRDGDVLQLGVDYQGGTEEIYRCVKMRVELNRGWQRGVNSFNSAAMRQIRAFGNVVPKDEGQKGTKGASARVVDKKDKKPPTGAESTDCCICLFSVAVYQALFIAPCSHIFHFKCIRPLLVQHHPGFSCPLCRTFADLEADVEQDDVAEDIEIEEEDGSEHDQQPTLPPKDDLTASLSSHLNRSPAVASSAAEAPSSGQLDTLRPGMRSPRTSPDIPGSISEVTGHINPAAGSNGHATTRPSLDRAATVVSKSGRRSMSGSLRRGHERHGTPPPGASPADNFLPPSAGDFDADIRRSRIFVHGADGQSIHIPITGRSRPSSVFEEDLGEGHIGSISAVSSRARSVRSLRMSTRPTANEIASPPLPTARASADFGHSQGASEYHDTDGTDHSDHDVFNAPLAPRPETATELPHFGNVEQLGSPMSVYTAPEEASPHILQTSQSPRLANSTAGAMTTGKGKARATSTRDRNDFGDSDGSASSSLDTGDVVTAEVAKLSLSNTVGATITANETTSSI